MTAHQALTRRPHAARAWRTAKTAVAGAVVASLVVTLLAVGGVTASASAVAPAVSAEETGAAVAPEATVDPQDDAAADAPAPQQDEPADAVPSPSTDAPTSDSSSTPDPSSSPSSGTQRAARGPPLARAANEGGVSILAAGVPLAPTPVWTEDFEGVSGTAAAPLGSSLGNAYTADAFWLAYGQCNGVLAEYATTDASLSSICTATSQASRNNIRRLADALGQLRLGVPGAATADTATATGTSTTTPNGGSQGNRALTEWTESQTGTAGQTLMLGRSAGAPSLGIAASGPRYYVARLDMGEASCAFGTRAQVTLGLAVGTGATPSMTSRAFSPCTETTARWYTSPALQGGWNLGGNGVAVGTFTSDASLLLTAAQAAQLRPVVRNNNLASGGNDLAVDNLRILDATPTLDKAFASDTVVAGTPTTLTFTITNTSELAAKSDWSFSDALPTGLVVAPSPSVGGTCANATGAAYSVQATAGSGTIAASGGDLAAGAVSCTVTVNVVANTPGTYVNGPSNVTTVLNAPENATLVVEAPARLTILKNVTGRAIVGDQFRLALSQGATEIATATTLGAATGVQTQRVGPIAVARGATYTISESIVSTATLNTYVTSYQCVRGTTTIATGTSVSGPITIPDEPGAEIVCTFTNTPQPASLYCDGTYFYGVRSNGSIVQVNATSTAAPTQVAGAVTSATDVNALGVSGDGSSAIAIDRATNSAGNAGAVVNYTIVSGALQATRTTLTTAQGAFLDRAGATLDGTIIAGAVDPLNGRFVVGKSAAGSVRLWEYTPTALNNGSRFLYLGQVATGTTAGENGDVSFDAQGNLHIVQTAADSSNVGMFSVSRESLVAATGGTIPATATVRRALSGTDSGFALTAVNGMAFSPAGTVYLGNATVAYQFDPVTWVRVPNSPRATIGTTATGAGATDLAACASPSTLSLEKNVVGRVNAADQFRLALASGSPAVESSTAVTSGTATGVQAGRIAPTPVQINTSVTISETMASGSASQLSAYTSVYECWADGVRLFTGTEKSATITIPNRLSVGVACTFTNSPAPFATVRVTKIVEDWRGAARTPTPGWTMTTTAAANAGSTVSILPSRNPSQQTGADGSATWQVLFGAASHRGRVTVAETTQTGYRYQSLVCTVNGTAGATTVTTTGDQVRGALNVDIAPGATVECVYTNRPVATLTLVKNVSYGSAAPSAWQLSATRSLATALPGPTGAGGSGTVNAVTVSADTPYRLAEAGGPATYVQVGAWDCVTAAGAAVPVSSAGDLTLTRATAVTCTVTNATASVVLLKNVQSPQTGFQPSTWNLTATPAALAGLGATTVAGADYAATGNPASTFDVRPGHAYTLTEALAQTGTRLAYQQLRVEVRQPNGSWTPVATASSGAASITAPAAGQTAVYRFVNAPVQPATLPLTGGTSTDAFLLGGSAVLVLALALAVWHGRRRTRRSAF
ncbi:LPXTG-motif cell wall-anchored protein [Microbacterium sp. AG1240]|uniref:DUF7933 domain-containing protein n=1 Tax=Microbacterium sp. AG1240 TaxID=2183992 RepID=UPI000F1DB78B|nr:LPXTG cell wall anchor domain-containing protein [Microbacterium sp. AG1240]RKT35947.1 LPXTG-motif cell wall-anchored protein [Microbacterium sp. AG1240]